MRRKEKKQNNDQKNKFQKKAFTLIELSIVLVIAAIMISTSLSSSVETLRRTKEKATKAKMEEVYKAIGNYLLVHKRLPCPSSLKKKKDSDSTYGLAAPIVSGECNGPGVYMSAGGTLFYGALPIKDLGLLPDMGEDEFGNKFSFMVHKNGISVDSFSTSAEGALLISEVRNSGEIRSSWKEIFIIISHGANGYNAFPANSSVQNSASPTFDEAGNSIQSINDATSPPTASYNEHLYATHTQNEIFDDILFYKTKSQIVVDFNAMHLLKCIGEPNGGNPWYPDAYYGQTITALKTCLQTHGATHVGGTYARTRRCGPFNEWADNSSGTDYLIEECELNHY